MAEKRSRQIENTQINESRIRYSDYTRTLLSEGLRAGIIRNSDCAKFSTALAGELSHVLKSYIGEPEEEYSYDGGADAVELLRALLFTVDTYLISLGDHKKAMKMLKSVKPESLHDMRLLGVSELRALQFEALSLCFKAHHTFTGDQLPAYTKALKKCREMILSYDREFMPHIVADQPGYPTAVPFSPIGGIKYIRRYLLCLTYENDFCLTFDENIRRDFFGVVQRSKATDENGRAENIYKYFLIGALICAHLKKAPGSLLLTKDDCKLLYSSAREMDDDRLCASFEGALRIIGGGNNEYNTVALEQILPSLISAIRDENLESVAVIA